MQARANQAEVAIGLPPLGRPTAPLQRSRGKLVIGLYSADDGTTRLRELFQQGCLAARLPRPAAAGTLDVVMMNTAGGLTGGDELTVEVSLDAAARATFTTPACERIYRSIGGDACIDQRLEIGRGACLHWIPRETILYDGGRLRRSVDVELINGAELLVAETLLLGRAAMGEAVERGAWQDRWTLRRAGRLVYCDAVRLVEPIGRAVAGATVLGGRTAVVSLVHAGTDLAAKCEALRATFETIEAVAGGASLTGEVLVARIVAPDSRVARRALEAALRQLIQERALPRGWAY